MARKRKFSETELYDYGNTSSDSEFSESNGKRPVARNAANARERARMRVLSKAFTRLKTSLPWVPADTKLSKLDTLRLAASYISHLRQILAEDQTFPTTSIHPLNLTWPFTLHNKPSNSDSVDPMSSTTFQQYLQQYPDYYQSDRHHSITYKNSVNNCFYQTYETEAIESHNYS